MNQVEIMKNMKKLTETSDFKGGELLRLSFMYSHSNFLEVPKYTVRSDVVLKSSKKCIKGFSVKFQFNSSNYKSLGLFPVVYSLGSFSSSSNISVREFYDLR